MMLIPTRKLFQSFGILLFIAIQQECDALVIVRWYIQVPDLLFLFGFSRPGLRYFSVVTEELPDRPSAMRS
jgi:hypothetical protein